MARSPVDRTLGDILARPQSLPGDGWVRIQASSPLSMNDIFAIEDSRGKPSDGANDLVPAGVLKDALLRHAVLHPHEKSDTRIRYLDSYLRHRHAITRISLPARVGYGAACFDAFASSAGLRGGAVDTISNVLWAFVIPEQRATWKEGAQFQIPPTHEGFRALFEGDHFDAVIASLQEIVDWVVDAGSSAIAHGAADFGSIAATIGAMHVVERCGAHLPAFAPFGASVMTEGGAWEREVSIQLRERAMGHSPFRG